MKDTLTCDAIIVYHYDFVNKEGRQVKSSKLLVNIKGLPTYINAKGFSEKKIYSAFVVDVYYDGKQWKVK